MRHKVENGPAIARHNDRLATFNRASKFGQPVLSVSNRNGLHGFIVATSGYFVNAGTP
jgi:hypothetical protein